jgi:type IX secretion system PorP/SprF family membrane protein
LNFKPLKVIIIVIATLSSSYDFLRAQELHFSQIQSVPLSINPANTGIGDEDLRFSNNYRNQWRQIDYPFQTLSISLDKKLLFLGRLVGIGATVIHDQSAGTLLSTDKICISISHSFFYQQNQFVIGLQPSLVFRNLNNNNLTFGSQFDPLLEKYNPGLASSEDNLKDKKTYFDLNVGFLWRSKINNLQPSAGFSVQHINRPDNSFFVGGDKSRLPMQFNVHGIVDVPLIQHFEVSPLIYYSLTNGTNEIMSGILTSYIPGNPNFAVEKLSFISNLRLNPFTNIDALILGVGGKILNFNICFTYDLTVSKLRKASNIQGAWEISLIYLSNPGKNKKKTEPCYML